MSVLCEESTRSEDEREDDNSNNIMKTVTGIICDLSASMRDNAGGHINDEKRAWSRSVVHFIDDLIRNDDLKGNFVFAIALGASCRDSTFDVLTTIEQFNDCKNTAQDLSHNAIVQKIFDILEKGGARNIRKWATTETVVKSISYDMASLFLNMLHSNKTFLHTFVFECLPTSCRNWDTNAENDGGFWGHLQGAYSSVVTSVHQASEREIKNVVEKAKNKLLQNVRNVCTVQHAYQIIHGSVGTSRLTNDRVKHLMKMVEPFIYGSKPMNESLDQALELFKNADYKKHTKILFILSDGESSDIENPDEISKRFTNENVFIVSCFIDKRTDIEPRRLYSKVTRRFSPGAELMFDLSSSIPALNLPRTLFVKRGWIIDISRNQTKLFMQVNDPENIHDACDLAKNAVCSQDALSDLLVLVSLDIKIYQDNSALIAPEQVGQSCYANASATVVHLSMKRILGREGGYPDFQQLRQDIINRYGRHPTNTLRVLREICPIYRLQYNEIGIEQALKAISEKRPVVAIFGLTADEWSIFNNLYSDDENKNVILTNAVVDISKRTPGFKLHGHAVVLMSYNSEWLSFMNSWGSEWADSGFFRVQNEQVLDMKFIDVFWTSKDLLSSEKAYYKKHGGKVARWLMNELIGIQKAEYKCPICQNISLVIDFKGTLHEAICPKCREKFKCNESGNILAMNIYLTSLATNTRNCETIIYTRKTSNCV